MTNIFSEGEVALLRRAERLVDAVPDIPGLRCHELTRAVAQVLGLRVVDGKYGYANHTWIAVEAAARPDGRILDVYAVGQLPQVRILDTHFGLQHVDRGGVNHGIYKPGPDRDDIDTGLVARIVAVIKDVR